MKKNKFPKPLAVLNALQFFQVLRFSSTLLIGILLVNVFHFSTGDIAIYEVILFLSNFVSFFWISAGQKGLLTLFPSATGQQGKLLFNIFLLLFVLGFVAASALYFGQYWIIRQLTRYENLELDVQHRHLPPLPKTQSNHNRSQKLPK